jgi:hypothetical protein
MGKILIHSNLSFNLYRLTDCFEIQQVLSDGNLITFKTVDNAMLTKWLDDTGLCADRLQALDVINHSMFS